jgi:hypothetical protein
MYLRDMGVDPALIDNVDRSSETGHAIEIPLSEWLRLRIVTASSS